MADVEIGHGYIPGAIGRVAELHGTYYHWHWKFDLFFEAKVATELAAFLERYDAQRDGFWTASPPLVHHVGRASREGRRQAADHHGD